MKIAITGHTKGIGEAIYSAFEIRLLDYAADDFTLTGFSRTAGWNITLPDVQNAIATQIKDYDIFVNNAYSGFAQTELLYKVFHQFHNVREGKPKTIINISSNSSNGTKSWVHPYAIHKASLDKACEQLQNIDTKCKIVNLRFGFVDTDRTKQFADIKLNPNDIAEKVMWIIDQPHNIYINTLEFKVFV